MKPYPEYKDSNLPWLGKIPEHWDVLPNRSLFEERKIQNTKNEELLSVTITKGVIKQTELLQNSSKKDTSNLDKSKYKLVMPGDIAYNKMRMWQGAVGVSKYRGIVSPAYIVLRGRQNIHPEYYHFLFRTPQYTGESYRYSYGICDDQLSLRYEDFKTINSPLPPLEEQKQMVKFLNYKCSKIAKFIRNKRRLIELLQEQKQAIINQAVTRGINPNVRLKPSGVDYLGDIPEHWNTIRLKYAFKKNIGGVWGEDQKNNENDVVCVRVVDFDYDNLCVDSSRLTIRNISSAEIVDRLLSNGDIILEKSGGGEKTPVGRAVLYNLSQKAVCSNFTNRLKVDTNYFDGNYLIRVLFYLYIRGMTVYSIKQTTGIQNLDIYNYFCNYIPIPPKEEQRKIVEYIKTMSYEINKVITRTKQEIDLIREYQTRLIYDVVTGKVDVRDIPVEPIEEPQSDEGLDMVEEEQMQEELENFEEKTYENL